MSNYTVDQPDKMRRMVFGDNPVASPDPLGGSATLAGVSLSRDFGLNPYFVRFPTFNLFGQVLNPSIARLYVNGFLEKSFTVAPGEFSLSNLPLPQGVGTAQLIVTDNFGNKQILTLPYYFAEQILKKGVQDYSYNLGYVREGLGTRSFDYGPLAFMGHYETGLSDSFTAGMRLESRRGAYSLGPSVIVQLPIGVIQASGGWSRAEGGTGNAYIVNYGYTQSAVNLGLSFEHFSPFYSNFTLAPEQDRVLQGTSFFVGFSAGLLGSLNLNYSVSRFRDAGQSNQLEITESRSLGHGLSFFSSFFRTVNHQRKSNSVFLGLNYYLGNGLSASTSYEKAGNSPSESLTFQKSLPAGVGYGYSLQAFNSSSGIQSTNLFEYQGRAASVQVNNQIGNGQITDFFNVSGGFVGIGGKLFATRQVGQGYALVQVPGVPGVKIYASNQEIGTTDRHGDLLVPNLLPYFANSISIATEDIPLNYSLSVTKKMIAIPDRGGAVVTFPVRRFQMVTGSVVIATPSKKIVPAYGELVVSAEGKEFTSPLGDGAEFYFENIPPGSHAASVKYNGEVYKGIFKMPSNSSSEVDLGTVEFVAPQGDEK